MPTFQYQAKRPDGTFENGIAVGASLDGVARDLAQKGLDVTQLGFAATTNDPIPSDFGTPQPPRNERRFETPTHAAVGSEAPRSEVPRSEAPRVDVPRAEIPRGDIPVGQPLEDRSYFATSVAGPLVGKVSINLLAFFFRQAATMLRAGVGIVQAMNTLSNQARDPRLGRVLKETADQVQIGNPMSTALSRYPEIFTPVMISVLVAGEKGGFVDEALETIADYLDQEIELRNLYRQATLWPKIELGASIFIIIVANAIIRGINPGAGTLSSPLTEWATWVVLTPIIVALFLFFRVGLANQDVRVNWDHIIAKIPYLGTTLQQIAMARFGRAFAALYRAGVPLQNIIILSANACGNEYLKSLMLPAAAQIEQGHGIAETLTATHAFSPIVLDMIRTGETTGNLDKMLAHTAEFYIEEAKVRQKKLGLLVGLAVFLFVACYIGYIVINFYTGYFSGITSAANS